jgi:hypothetical protein
VDGAELFGQVNDSIRRLASGGSGVETWEFLCECPDVECHAMVSLTLLEFDERRSASPPVPILARHGSAYARRSETQSASPSR